MKRPTVLWDGDCGFCKLWVDRWAQQVGDAVVFETFQDAGDELAPGVSEDEFRAAMHLVEPDGTVRRGADAVFAALSRSGYLRHRAAWTLQQRSRVFSVLTTNVYRRVAASRSAAYKLTKVFWGEPNRGGFSLARDLFLRLLGIVAVIASWSLLVQVDALYGADGILPHTEYLAWVEQVAAGDWKAKLVRAPTILWWLPADSGLQICAYGGIVCGVLLTLGVAPRLTIPGVWIAYASIMGVGRVFLNFQWDALLLESLVVAWFLAPWSLFMRPKRLGAGRVGHVAARFLLFKLMWLSGWVKLASNDANWSSFEALEFHFWTQPLPTWSAYWVDKLPDAALSIATVGMFFIELVVPFFIFAPRRARHVAAGLLIALQLGIAATGNYGFFNLLAIALTILLFDDGAFRNLSERFESVTAGLGPAQLAGWRQIASAGVCVALLSASAVGFFGRFQPAVVEMVPRQIRLALQTSRSFNGYGLFAVMTTDRREIFIELSRDGSDWERVRFAYKPGELDERPEFIGPHMPRLDWQMWFAGLGGCSQNSWLIFTARELAEQNDDVIALFDEVPRGSNFRYARFPSYQYRFGDDEWWSRTEAAAYCPTIEFSDGQIRTVERSR